MTDDKDMNTSDALSISSASKIFRTATAPLTAVKQVSFTVGQGEVLALLGENGAGKTTLIDMILGLSSPSSGQVLVHGQRPQQAIRAGKISAVLQTGGLLNDLSVYDQLAMIAATYDQHLPLDNVIEIAGLKKFISHKIGKCSGGQQQKVRFALALLGNPEILILDEPTTGMDVNARARFWESMYTLAQQGKTILFATHYLEEAQNFARRIILLDQGRVIADDSVKNLRRASGYKTVSFTLSAETPLTHQMLERFCIGNFSRSGDRYRVESAAAESLLGYLLKSYLLTDLEVTSPSLDQEFSRLIAHAHSGQEKEQENSRC